MIASSWKSMGRYRRCDGCNGKDVESGSSVARVGLMYILCIKTCYDYKLFSKYDTLSHVKTPTISFVNYFIDFLCAHLWYRF